MTALNTTSYWRDSSTTPPFNALDRDLTVDVVVIGAGITGLTTGYLLKKAGRTVAVIDRGPVGGVDSSHTTAHVTHVTDVDLSELVKNFGRDHAQAVWDAGRAAIDEIETIVDREDIDCEWTRVPVYKHAPVTGGSDADAARLRQEATTATELGFGASYMDTVPLAGTPGVEFPDQALFHPGKYLAALAALVDGDGSHVFGNTESGEVTDEPVTVKANGHTLSCGHVVIATHTPIIGKAAMAGAIVLQTKLYLYTSYVIGGRLPSDSLPEASFCDTADPYQYVRVTRYPGFDYVIIGGQDHKTGQEADPAGCFAALESSALSLLPDLAITHRWSGQVVETNDGLPFIGETAPRQFAGTGYAGNGMTFGTVAAIMARDYVTGATNPWQELFDVGRTKIKGGAWDYLKENIDYPYYMIRDWFASAEGTSLRALQNGEGKILKLKGEQVAAYKGPRGAVTLLSPVCTHMGCNVAWNNAERTWDCPCHGSRFAATGAVIAGPAETPLERAKQNSQQQR